MELGTYVIGILFPLDMNQDEDEPLYLQSRTWQREGDSKKTEDALTGICFCVSSPSAAWGLLSHCVGSGSSSQMDISHQRLWKKPQLLTLALLQPHLCAVPAGWRWLQPCPWLGTGQAGEDSPSTSCSWKRSSVNGYSAWGEEQQSFELFNLISVGLQEDQHTSPKVPPLFACFSSRLAVSSKAGKLVALS